jgi:hypothetical protein
MFKVVASAEVAVLTTMLHLNVFSLTSWNLIHVQKHKDFIAVHHLRFGNLNVEHGTLNIEFGTQITTRVPIYPATGNGNPATLLKA